MILVIFSINVQSLLWLVSDRRSLPLYTRTTQRASSGGNNVIDGCEQAKHIDIRKQFAHKVIQIGEMLLKDFAQEVIHAVS
jgi:hypothetical protein